MLRAETSQSGQEATIEKRILLSDLTPFQQAAPLRVCALSVVTQLGMEPATHILWGTLVPTTPQNETLSQAATLSDYIFPSIEGSYTPYIYVNAIRKAIIL